MSIDIRRVTGASDLEAVYRQRYAIYVRELGWAQAHADRAREAVAEPLDEQAFIFGAFDGERLVASARVCYGNPALPDGGFGDYVRWYRMRRFGPWFPQGIGITTRLMIEPEYRRSTLLARLALAMYVHEREHMPAVRFSMIDCVHAGRTLYERLGYRVIAPGFINPTAGLTIPMALAVCGRQHLLRVGSVFARVCPYHDAETARWFEERLLLDEASA